MKQVLLLTSLFSIRY